MNNKDRISIENRLTNLEARMGEVGLQVKEIIENHLPHLAGKMDRLQWLLITNLVVVIILLLSKYL